MFIGQPVRAHDADGRKLLMQLPDIIEAGEFQVYNGGVCPVLRDRTLEILKVDGHIDHPEMGVKRPDQQLRTVTIALEDNNTQRLHDGTHLSSFVKKIRGETKVRFRRDNGLQGFSARAGKPDYFLAETFAFSWADS
jgi:hypothetical protein